MKILYIDDDPAGRLIMSRILQENGNVCDTARGIRDGMASLMLKRYDFVVMDYRLSSLETIEPLFKYLNGTPAAVYTCHSPDEINKDHHIPYPIVEKNGDVYDNLFKVIVDEVEKAEMKHAQPA